MLPPDRSIADRQDEDELRWYVLPCERWVADAPDDFLMSYDFEELPDERCTLAGGNALCLMSEELPSDRLASVAVGFSDRLLPYRMAEDPFLCIPEADCLALVEEFLSEFVILPFESEFLWMEVGLCVELFDLTSPSEDPRYLPI